MIRTALVLLSLFTIGCATAAPTERSTSAGAIVFEHGPDAPQGEPWRAQLAALDLDTGVVTELDGAGMINVVGVLHDRRAVALDIAGDISKDVIVARDGSRWTTAPTRPLLMAIAPDGKRGLAVCDAALLCIGALAADGTFTDGPEVKVDQALAIAWLPGRVVFIERGNAGEPTVVRVADEQTGAVTTAGALLVDEQVVVSPDGALVAWGTGDRRGVGVAPLADLTQQRVYALAVGGGVLGSAQCAFADGNRRLVCQSVDTSRAFVLDSIDLASGAVTRLDTGVTGAGPVVSPDGRSVVYARARPGRAPHLTVASVDRAEPRELATNAERQFPLAWLR